MKKIELIITGIILLFIWGCSDNNNSVLSPDNGPNVCYFMELQDNEGYTTSYLGVPPDDWEPNYRDSSRAVQIVDFSNIVIELDDEDHYRSISQTEKTLVIENAYPSEYINAQLGNFFDLSDMTKYVIKTVKTTGGQISWDGCTEDGEQCPTGFYKYTIKYEDYSKSDFILLLVQDGIPGWDPSVQN